MAVIGTRFCRTQRVRQQGASSVICIFCGEQQPPSKEHVFPLAIGGTITTDRVCSDCNSELGTRVDAALTDFLPVRMRRAKLGLAGNNGAVPSWHEIFVGQADVIGEGAGRVQTIFNRATGKLETRRLYHAENVITPDGKKSRRITLDVRDKNQIPKIIQRERKRHSMPPLSDEELAAASGDFTTTAVENPIVRRSISVSFAYLRHAMVKIAYEFAFLWLGEAYLTDPIAVELRAAVCDTDLASTDRIEGYIGEADGCTAFKGFWLPHEAHHVAYATIVNGRIIICLRVFDIYAAAVVVSHDPSRYVGDAADRGKLRFLVIDSVSGESIDSTFDEESRRIAAAMTTYRRLPPFSDALTPVAARQPS
jgi:hypothetical protein